MNVVEIADAFIKNDLTLLQACRKLDALGYTFQEIRRIVRGAIHSTKIGDLYNIEAVAEGE